MVKRVVYGTIDCPTGESVPDDYNVTVSVYDASWHIMRCGGNKPADLLGNLEITDKKTFPMEYRLEYNDQEDYDPNHMHYYLSVTVSKPNEASLFCNELGDKICQHSPMLGKPPAPVREHIDVTMRYYPKSD